MASRDNSRRCSSQLVVKEGFLSKKRGILKSWSRKYFMLNKQSLVYFKKEQEAGSPLTPQGRLFLSDIVRIDRGVVDAKKEHVFSLHTKKRAILLSVSSAVEKESWVTAIEGALHSEGEAERKDPFRRTLRQLAPGLKRVTLMKDPVKGIGCTIKSAAGHIFVNRIIEDGPIAQTGVLRPDDELLDVNGVSIIGMTIAEVGKVIQGCPSEFLATVCPITTLKRFRQDDDVSRVNYFAALPNLGSKLPLAAESESGEQLTSQPPTFVMKVTSEGSVPSDDSLDDMGIYDDELSGAERSPTHSSSPETGESCPMSPSMPEEAAIDSSFLPAHTPSPPLPIASSPSSPAQTLTEEQRSCNYTDAAFSGSGNSPSPALTQ